MPYTDEAGITHITQVDEVSVSGITHLLECERCQIHFPIAYNRARGHVMPNQYGPDETLPMGANLKTNMRDMPSNIEDTIREIGKVDAQITDLLNHRNELTDRAQSMHHANQTALRERDDFFQGYVRGNPVDERPTDPEPTRGW